MQKIMLLRDVKKILHKQKTVNLTVNIIKEKIAKSTRFGFLRLFCANKLQLHTVPYCK